MTERHAPGKIRGVPDTYQPMEEEAQSTMQSPRQQEAEMDNSQAPDWNDVDARYEWDRRRYAEAMADPNSDVSRADAAKRDRRHRRESMSAGNQAARAMADHNRSRQA